MAALTLQGCVEEYIKPIPSGDRKEEAVADDELTTALKAVIVHTQAMPCR